MKAKLLLALGVVGIAVVLAGAGALAYQHYQNTQTKKEAQAQAAQEAANRKLQAFQAGVQRAKLVNESLRAECQKGAVAYAKLPLSVQKTISPTAPVCTATLD